MPIVLCHASTVTAHCKTKSQNPHLRVTRMYGSITTTNDENGGSFDRRTTAWVGEKFALGVDGRVDRSVDRFVFDQCLFPREPY